jgi:hypothetical protein
MLNIPSVKYQLHGYTYALIRKNCIEIMSLQVRNIFQSTNTGHRRQPDLWRPSAGVEPRHARGACLGAIGVRIGPSGDAQVLRGPNVPRPLCRDASSAQLSGDGDLPHHRPQPRGRLLCVHQS